MTGVNPALTCSSSCGRRMTDETMDEERDEGSDGE